MKSYSYYFVVLIVVVIGITSNAFRLTSLSSSSLLSSSLSLSRSSSLSSIYILNHKRQYDQRYNSNNQFLMRTISSALSSSSSPSSSSRSRSLQLKMGLLDGLKKSVLGSSNPIEALNNENDKLMKVIIIVISSLSL